MNSVNLIDTKFVVKIMNKLIHKYYSQYVPFTLHFYANDSNIEVYNIKRIDGHLFHYQSLHNNVLYIDKKITGFNQLKAIVGIMVKLYDVTISPEIRINNLYYKNVSSEEIHIPLQFPMKITNF